MVDKKELSITKARAPPPLNLSEAIEDEVLNQKTARILKNDLLLHEAVIKNEADTVRKVLKETVDVDSRNNYGRAPIHWAASRGNTEIIEMLIQAKCDIEAKDKKQYTLLMCGARGSNVGVVEYLAEAVESLNGEATDCTGATALHHAAVTGHPAVITALSNIPRIVLDATDKKGQTPMHCACAEEHLEGVEVLIGLGANVDAQDNDGNTPLHVATRTRHTGIAQLLLKARANTELTDAVGFTPLHVAASQGCKGILDSMIQHGADLNKQCKNGNTPLHLACQNNEVDTVEILINKGVDLNCLNLRLQSPIHIAAEMGHTDICELLLAAGANIEQKEQSGRTPLYIAARGSFTAIVDMIIKTARLDYPTLEISSSDKEARELTPARRRWREGSRGGSISSNNGGLSEQMRSILWKLAYKQLAPGDWKKLALHWAFTHDQIRAIEHQYTVHLEQPYEKDDKAPIVGPSSYKEHGFRMLLIWASGLNPDVPLAKELCEALSAVGKKAIADSVRKQMDQENAKAKSKSRRCHKCSIA
ncbi:ankyrin repeat and death domain-containing protein 1A isoform X4 [Harpegnathos saltator]|uniref:ankyrin repeat and death domain-containing protein 1A isoform X4 n=1 Tax=Harpegnathos saltator TaxID=610380 RepID=UPI000DBED325|nr:ankyrin repeat and death domain-containing protein 1A isoform X4 [Harpegnathos saltator]